MCNASFGLSQAFERLALLMLGAVGFIHVRWQKTFLLELYRYIDTQGREVLGERGLERLFSITANYITVRLACAKTKPK